MTQRLFMEGLRHFKPILRAGLETQKWINYSNPNWFRFFLETGQVQHPKVLRLYSEKIANHTDVLERIEILNLIENGYKLSDLRKSGYSEHLSR